MSTSTALPEIYQICLGVRLAPDRASWFDEMAIAYDDEGRTILTGALLDQAALHGVLAKVRDMGLPLISVTRLDTLSTSTPASAIIPSDEAASA